MCAKGSLDDAGASRGIRAILCHPKKIYLDLVSVSCLYIFGYPFGSNKGSNSHSSTISVFENPKKNRSMQFGHHFGDLEGVNWPNEFNCDLEHSKKRIKSKGPMV